MVDPDKTDRVKLGVTKNPDQRLQAYRTSNPSCYYHALYRDIPLIHEKRILDEFRGMFKVQSEYVHCSAKLSQNIVEGYFEDHGIEY